MKITEALAAEHRIFLSVFDQIERALPSLATPLEIQTMAGIVERLLQEHAEAETNLAYLALDHALAETEQLEQMYQDHHEIDGRLKKVRTANTCAEARRLLHAVIQYSREHFRGEERVLFPLLEKALQPETLTELGRAWANREAEPAGI
jgi:hemerythrin-like domain-containing protein